MSKRLPGASVKKILYLAALICLPCRAFSAQCEDLFANSPLSATPNEIVSSPEIRASWIRAQNRLVNTKLSQSPNIKKVEALMYTLFSKDTIKQIADIRQLGTLKLIDRGLSVQNPAAENRKFTESGENKATRATELVLFKAYDQRVLFSTKHFKDNHVYSAVEFQLSPQKDFVIVKFNKSGSTDDYTLIVYDLKADRIVSDSLVIGRLDTPWVDDHSFIFNRPGNLDGPQIAKFDVREPSNGQSTNWKSIISLKHNWFAASSDDEGFRFYHADGRSVSISQFEPNFDVAGGPLLVEKDGQLYVQIKSSTGFPSVVQVKIPTASSQSTQTEVKRFISEQPLLYNKVSEKDGYWFVDGYFGRDRVLQIRDDHGAMLHTINLPDCCALSEFSWDEKGKSLRVTLASAVQSAKVFNYDLETKSYAEVGNREKGAEIYS